MRQEISPGMGLDSIPGVDRVVELLPIRSLCWSEPSNLASQVLVDPHSDRVFSSSGIMLGFDLNLEEDEDADVFLARLGTDRRGLGDSSNSAAMVFTLKIDLNGLHEAD